MRARTRQWITLGLLVATGMVLGTGCGGGGNDPSGRQATIDMAGVERAIDQVATALPICEAGGAGVAPAAGEAALPWLTHLLAMRRAGLLRPTLSVQGLGPTRPADEFGECGGRMTYTDYNHANGVTSGTLAFESFCEVNDNTGERNISTGEIAFVNTGTPSASGPITERIEASSPGGVTVETRNAGGQQLGRQNLRFTNYLYRAGVPGGTPTAASPDRLTLEEGRLTDLTTNKVYRQTNLTVAYSNTTGGGEQLTVSGRGYRSNGEWYQVTTTAPVTSDADGDILGGALTFSGAGGSTAILTLVPGSRLQATMRVNGTPVTGLPACQ